MFLRAAIVILTCLNLGAVAWWVAGSQPNRTLPPPPEAPQLRLVAELKPAAVAKPAAADGVCLRFGPFAGPAARTGAAESLAAIGVQATPFEDRSGAASGWDVFLPAQADHAAAVALVDKLKTAGVADVFVMNDGRNANRIALGRFSSEAGARRRVDELRAQGVAPVIEARGNGSKRIWLDARLPASIGQARVAAIAPSQALDCSHLQ
ncbi:MAG: SPOR domain-containing protein [Proteobacteria bacterium]|nr:SPOR domain-containing protein [Pseudomonadota bacterium]